ncbi:MAG: asparagine synthase (glutamine-hydrolyzing) [Bacteroidales bacterium]|nr:asparagine synthase (glutamine-hydrolyzing) [Bacteroidales bacterium]
MCGICGFIDYKFKSEVSDINKMVQALNHRGPDDSGNMMFNSDKAVIGLGHARLSIIDLSAAGHQPMRYKKYVISYNGEIYNYAEIKKDLESLGHTFVSGTDTEVILHAFEEWGIECLDQFIGMFAFALLDLEAMDFLLVRDRTGVKPLYYHWDDQLFLFGSELKSFYQHPSFDKQIDINATHQYFNYGYVPAPYCIFKNCKKLLPGHYLKLKINTKELILHQYWDIKACYSKPCLDISYDEAVNQLDKLLISAFNYRMVSDVPVGIFLSGGYDSTAVASILQRYNSQQLKTFTIGFGEGVNEAPFAKKIAQYLGTDHKEYYCTTKEAQDIVPTLPYYFDEPYADNSAIPTILVSQFAKQDITVALSADGGDEIFAGYDHYKTLYNNLALINKIPRASNVILSHLSAFTATHLKEGDLSHKLASLSQVLKKENRQRVSQYLLDSYYAMDYKTKTKLLQNSTLFRHTVYEDDYSSFNNNLSIALATDYKMYLPDDVLVKVDRATMSVSLEGREPLLDHRIIEYVAQLPASFKFGHTQKQILKDLVHRYIPSHLMDRPKTGFDVPLKSWLMNDLSYLVEDSLNANAIADMGLFNVAFVKKLKHNFLNGRIKDFETIWKLIQFHSWYKLWIS